MRKGGKTGCIYQKWREKVKKVTKLKIQDWSKRDFDWPGPEHAWNTVNWNDVVYMGYHAVTGLNKVI